MPMKTIIELIETAEFQTNCCGSAVRRRRKGVSKYRLVLFVLWYTEQHKNVGKSVSVVTVTIPATAATVRSQGSVIDPGSIDSLFYFGCVRNGFISKGSTIIVLHLASLISWLIKYSFACRISSKSQQYPTVNGHRFSNNGVGSRHSVGAQEAHEIPLDERRTH